MSEFGARRTRRRKRAAELICTAGAWSPNCPSRPAPPFRRRRAAGPGQVQKTGVVQHCRAPPRSVVATKKRRLRLEWVWTSDPREPGGPSRASDPREPREPRKPPADASLRRFASPQPQPRLSRALMPRRAAPCTGYVCRPLTMDELPRLCQSLEALGAGSLFDSVGLRLSALYLRRAVGGDRLFPLRGGGVCPQERPLAGPRP
jgi:hypothetical protein